MNQTSQLQYSFLYSFRLVGFQCLCVCVYVCVSAGWLFLDSSTSMFVNARGRVYRIPENKKKMKMGGAEPEKQKSSAGNHGNTHIRRLST